MANLYKCHKLIFPTVYSSFLTKFPSKAFYSTNNIQSEKKNESIKPNITGFVGCWNDETNELTPGAAELNTTLNFQPTSDAFFGVTKNASPFVKVCDDTVVAISLQNKKSNLREAIGTGIQWIQNHCPSVNRVLVDSCGDPFTAAESAGLAAFVYDELKHTDKQKTKLHLLPYLHGSKHFEIDEAKWCKGLLMAEGQNMARKLMEMPANLLTPTRFADIAEDILDGLPGINITTYDEQWIKNGNMGAFISVAQGSREPPKFIEIHYTGVPSSKKHVALVGKGVTFDTGGISIKPSANMDAMRADMGGAAVSLATVYTLARLQSRVNLRVYIPLCENMPDGAAVKPGDVVVARNKVSIQVDNTDAEGRLILADALCYASEQSPLFTFSVATLTGAMVIALGSAHTGVISNIPVEEDHIFPRLKRAGILAEDPFWLLPSNASVHRDPMKKCQLADINNVSSERGASSAQAATFLYEFVKPGKLLHLDIAGVMENKPGQIKYLRKGMSGRPTRSLVHFYSQLEEDFANEDI